MGHPIHKHMKSFQSRELTDMPIMHDEKGEGRGGHEGGPSPAKLHGSMKGDQSGTHRDYVNFKDTDPKYHGHTGASHGDQSGTHLDYLSGAKNLGSPAKQYHKDADMSDKYPRRPADDPRSKTYQAKNKDKK